jgi:lipid A 3-O-deacylase
MTTRWRCGWLALLSLSLNTAAWGDCLAPRPDRFGAREFQWENDSFNPSRLTDRDYTNGLRLAYTRNPSFQPHPRWTERLIEAWCRSGICGGDQHAIDVGYAVGQSIYTPARYDRQQAQPFDRPYAGHLFFSWLIQATHRDVGEPEDLQRVQTTIELQLGWVGPHAYGEQAQNGWHRLLNEEEAEGWANQLDDEPTFNVNVLWRRKLGGRHIDLVPHGGLALGTVSTHANAGATLRVGTNLNSLPQFGLPQLRRGEAGQRSFEISAYLAVDGRYVARNLFLDGGVFEKYESSRIEPEDFVYDIKAGITARWKSWTIHYGRTERSREFRSRRPLDGDRDQHFETYAITRHFTLH